MNNIVDFVNLFCNKVRSTKSSLQGVLENWKQYVKTCSPTLKFLCLQKEANELPGPNPADIQDSRSALSF